ncbi:Oxidation resistance protein [Ceraceosorus bombacis]|uniref:Oxidation resistance protein 1 n=1 Tax=Ceraceosorus bombacis TaxID=401625 RepID=A0A0P1BH79_9BASI|nr:Oxidation resistance protein [Ceraceosorus bombacis]
MSSSRASGSSPTRAGAQAQAQPPPSLITFEADALDKEEDGDFGAFVDPTEEASFSPSKAQHAVWSTSQVAGNAAASSSRTSTKTSPIHRPKVASVQQPLPPPSSSAEEEEWADASYVDKFSSPTQPRAPDLPDWDEPGWSAGHETRKAGQSSNNQPSPPRNAHSLSGNSADDEFFAAFERAALDAHAQASARASPPIIDLRPTERKLEEARKKWDSSSATTSTNNAEEDFFALFERAPQETLRRKRETGPGLLGDDLENMHDARSSPLEVRFSASGTAPHASSSRDYFGAVADSNGGGGQAHGGGARGEKEPDHTSEQISTPSSLGWTGSLRKTWGSIRGFPAGLAEHLPAASDFIVPATEGFSDDGDEIGHEGQAKPAWSARQPQQGKASRTPSMDQSKRGHSPLPAQWTDRATFNNSPSQSRNQSAASLQVNVPGPSRKSSSASRSYPTSSASLAPASAPAIPISGAPGFDANSTKRWNTGSWSLSAAGEAERSRRPIEVKLNGRSDDIEGVITNWHASRIQASLPARSRLGKSWKLLYSLDQHGISLGTLYGNVEKGLDPKRSRPLGEEDRTEEHAEGWMRGASGAAMAAATGRSISPSNTSRNGKVKAVGAGLQLQDAGIVVAVQDEDDNVFGAYVNERLRPQAGYYGSGECFLWRTCRAPTDEGVDLTDGAATSASASLKVQTYPWSGANDYMVLTQPEYLSFGGGEGRYGLWIDGKLEKGISCRCPAFDNDPLCDDAPPAAPLARRNSTTEHRFDCVGLEVWAVGID